MTNLDQLIEGVEVGVSALAICEVRQDAKYVLTDETNTTIHYVLSGTGTAWRSGGRRDPLAPHAFIIVPAGSFLAVSDERGADIQPSEADCEPLPEDWDSLTVGKGAPAIKLACGFLRTLNLESTGLFENPREPLVIDISDDTSFRVTFRRLLDELAAPQHGTRALAELMMKQCLIVLLRRQMEI
jgi:hypothetical protein